MADIFTVGVEYDGSKGIRQAHELGTAIEDAGEKGEKAGKRIAAGMSAGEEAAVRQIKQVQALRTAMQQQIQLGESMAAAINRDRQMMLQHSSALEQNTRLEKERAAAAHAAQVAIGEGHAAAIERDRKMILLHTQALEDNTRREIANAAAVRSMALAQGEALAMDRARTAQQSLMGRAQAGLASIGIAPGLAAGVVGFAVVSGGLRKVIDETKESQAAFAQLEAGVRSTGGAAGYTAQQLADMASELESTTGFTDEAIEAAQAMLLTFDRIAHQTFPGATQAAADLARKLGTDIQSQALQLGKALQDPEQGLTALRKAGISFSDAQTKVIRDLYNTGHAAEAQVLILREIQKEVGGAAAAYRTTLGGALDNLSHQFGNLFEASTSSSSGTVKAINAIADALHRLNEGTLRAQAPGRFIRDLVGLGPGPFADVTGGHSTTGGPKPAADLSAIKDLVAAQELEIQKQGALNAAYFKTDVELDKIRIHYEALAELQKNRINHLPDETAKLDANTKALERLKLVAADLANADFVNRMERFAKAATDGMAALRASQPQVTPRGLSRPEVAFLPKDFHAFDDFFKELDAMQRKSGEAAEKYAKDFADIWRSGIANLVTDGTKSFADFTQDVLRMFTQMLRRMEQEGQSSAALKLGVAGLTGGLAGYGIGQQTGQAAPSALGGFASGAFAGAAYGPWGAAIGGIVGAAGGLLGAAGAQKDAAERLKQAAQSLHDSITAYANESRNPVVSALQNELDRLATAHGAISAQYPEGGGHEAEFAAELERLRNAYKEHVLAIAADFWNGIAAQLNALDGPAGAFRNAMTAADRAFAQNMESATKLSASEEQLQQIRDLHNKTIEQLTIAEYNRNQQITLGLDLREAAATGNDKEAEAIRRRMKEEAEIFAAQQAGWSEEQIARLRYVQGLEAVADAERKAAEAAKHNAEVQASAQERYYNAIGDSDMAFAIQQQREWNQAIEDFGKGIIDKASLEWIGAAQAAEKAAREAQKVADAQRQALQTQAQAIQEQINAQQQTLDFYRNQADALRKFSTSLSLGGFSPLSPAQKYAEARQQFEIVGALAKAGDRSAIASLQDVVNTFLEASRGRFASSPGYVSDFQRAKDLVDSVADQTAAQIPVQEQILAQLKATLEYLQQRLAATALPKDIGANIPRPPSVPEIIAGIGPVLKPGDPRFDPGKPPGTGGPTLPGDPRFPGGRSNGVFDPYTGQTLSYGGTGRVSDAFGNYFDGSHWYDLEGNLNPWGYASGGDFRGGARLVGERGPEVEFTGPSRIVNAQQFNADVVTAVRRLEAKFDRLIESNDRQTRAITQTSDAQKERR